MRRIAGWAQAGLICSLLFSGVSQAGDFMDVRLSWVLAENNFLSQPGQSDPKSPGIGIGANESNTLFFDNYDTKYTGFETFGHLVLYKKMPAFFDGFYAEAALFLRIGPFAPDDQGSYINMIYDFSDANGDSSLELTLFPLSGDRFRMGYSYDISWGGDRVFPFANGPAPAAKLQLNLGWAYGFLGMKTARIRENINQTEQTENVTNYGVLTGAGVDLNGFVAEAKAAYFTRGKLPGPEVRGRGVYTTGFSYQLGYHQGCDIGNSIDFELYRNDPYMEEVFFHPEKYDGGLSFRIKHEGSFQFQNLADPDNTGQLKGQVGYAFDVNFALKSGYFRTHLDAVVSSLSFLLFDSLGFLPGQASPETATTRPMWWAALGVDYHFPLLRLTPGLKFGVKMPATYTAENQDLGGVIMTGKRTVVLKRFGQRSILPEGDDAQLVWSAKANLKWDYAEMLAIVFEAYFSYDKNQVLYVSDFNGLNVMTKYSDPEIFGLNLMAQARF